MIYGIAIPIIYQTRAGFTREKPDNLIFVHFVFSVVKTAG
jgi:hypothetical protein